MVRDLLQEFQAGTGAGAPGVRYTPLRPGPAIPAPRGNPYTRPCTGKKCRPPGTPVPLKPNPAIPAPPRGKPYTRPCRYGTTCKRPPGPGS
ncbi:hypothetical protein ACLOJK_033003 [Asimina triloba]